MWFFEPVLCQLGNKKKRKKNTPVLHLYSTLTRMIPENTTQLFWQNKFLSFFCLFSFLGLISITVSDRYIKRLTNKSLECRSSDWEENFVYRGNQLDENIVLSQHSLKDYMIYVKQQSPCSVECQILDPVWLWPFMLIRSSSLQTKRLASKQDGLISICNT